jgi:sugar lactone lactonase YvrE
VTGCRFGSDGQFYASEFSVNGWESFEPFTGALVQVAPHSTSPTVVAGGLSFPNGFASDGHGSLYVSNWSVAPVNDGEGPTGEVVRITP